MLKAKVYIGANICYSWERVVLADTTVTWKMV